MSLTRLLLSHAVVVADLSAATVAVTVDVVVAVAAIIVFTAYHDYIVTELFLLLVFVCSSFFYLNKHRCSSSFSFSRWCCCYLRHCHCH